MGNKRIELKLSSIITPRDTRMSEVTEKTKKRDIRPDNAETEEKKNTRLHFTSRIIIMTFKRRITTTTTDCNVGGVKAFPNRMIYLAPRWTAGITKNYEGMMDLIKRAHAISLLPFKSRGNALHEKFHVIKDQYAKCGWYSGIIKN